MLDIVTKKMTYFLAWLQFTSCISLKVFGMSWGFFCEKAHELLFLCHWTYTNFVVPWEQSKKNHTRAAKEQALNSLKAFGNINLSVCFCFLLLEWSMSHHIFTKQNIFNFSLKESGYILFCGHTENMTSVLYKPGDSNLNWVSLTTINYCNPICCKHHLRSVQTDFGNKGYFYFFSLFCQRS